MDLGLKKIGYLPRYLEAIRDGLTVMIEKMDAIRKNYCEKCGSDLFFSEKQVHEGYIEKYCPDCGSRYVFQK